MRTTLSFRDEITARLLTVGVPLDHWVFAELRTVDDTTEHAVAAGIFESAGEATTPFCNGWDDEVDVLVDEFSRGS